jgi:hypothetical protein
MNCRQNTVLIFVTQVVAHQTRKWRKKRREYGKQTTRSKEETRREAEEKKRGEKVEREGNKRENKIEDKEKLERTGLEPFSTRWKMQHQKATHTFTTPIKNCLLANIIAPTLYTQFFPHL